MGVTPEDLAAHRARVRALPVTVLRRKLLGMARTRGASEAVAEDLVQGAFTKLWARGAGAWDPAEDPEALRFLADAMKSARKSEAKKRGRRRTDLDTEKVEESPPSSGRGVVGTLLDREDAARAREELLRRLAVSP